MIFVGKAETVPELRQLFVDSDDFHQTVELLARVGDRLNHLANTDTGPGPLALTAMRMGDPQNSVAGLVEIAAIVLHAAKTVLRENDK